MKKRILIIVITLLIIFSAVGAASAKGRWIKGYIHEMDYLGPALFHTSQNGNILHVRVFCSNDWSSCQAKMTIYYRGRFSEQPVCEMENGEEYPAYGSPLILVWDDQLNWLYEIPESWVCIDYSDPWPVP